MSARQQKKIKNQAEKLKAYEAIEQARQKHFKIQLDAIARYYRGEETVPKISTSVRLPAPLVNDLDHQACLMGISRSELIVLALHVFSKHGFYVKRTGDFTDELEKLELI